MNAVVNAAGTNNRPASVADHPNIDCVYNGMMNVEPYKPNPRMNDNIVPTRRLPFFKTFNCTIGLRKVVSLQIKNKAPNVAITESTTIISLLNQSSSCPFSSIY